MLIPPKLMVCKYVYIYILYIYTYIIYIYTYIIYIYIHNIYIYIHNIYIYVMSIYICIMCIYICIMCIYICIMCIHIYIYITISFDPRPADGSWSHVVENHPNYPRNKSRFKIIVQKFWDLFLRFISFIWSNHINSQFLHIHK